jgi:hypothetical protein
MPILDTIRAWIEVDDHPLHEYGEKKIINTSSVVAHVPSSEAKVRALLQTQ